MKDKPGGQNELKALGDSMLAILRFTHLRKKFWTRLGRPTYCLLISSSDIFILWKNVASVVVLEETEVQLRVSGTIKAEVLNGHPVTKSWEMPEVAALWTNGLKILICSFPTKALFTIRKSEVVFST